jgi:hypothetical protein
MTTNYWFAPVRLFGEVKMTEEQADKKEWFRVEDPTKFNLTLNEEQISDLRTILSEYEDVIDGMSYKYRVDNNLLDGEEGNAIQQSIVEFIFIKSAKAERLKDMCDKLMGKYD